VSARSRFIHYPKNILIDRIDGNNIKILTEYTDLIGYLTKQIRCTHNSIETVQIYNKKIIDGCRNMHLSLDESCANGNKNS